MRRRFKCPCCGMFVSKLDEHIVGWSRGELIYRCVVNKVVEPSGDFWVRDRDDDGGVGGVGV